VLGFYIFNHCKIDIKFTVILAIILMLESFPVEIKKLKYIKKKKS